ncbi:MAG: N-terminal phage integrase SAM-like domain-containing protein, partial [Acidimicrobiales bacterium]
MGSVRRSPRDPSKWEVRYRDPAGAQRSKRLDTRAEAKAWLNRVETDIARGRWADPRLARTRFEVWAGQYMDGAVHLRPTTRETMTSSLRAHLLPRFGNVALGDITALQVRSFVAELAGTHQPAT